MMVSVQNNTFCGHPEGKDIHWGSMFAVITRLGLGFCDTARVIMKCATCPSAQGSAWISVVISGNWVFSMGVCITFTAAKIDIFLISQWILMNSFY